MTDPNGRPLDAIPESFNGVVLPPHFRTGLNALRESVGRIVEVELIHDNFAFIAIGAMTTDEMKLFDEESVRIYARVPLAFPDAQPYGFVTDPLLHRKDKQPIERQHASHSTALPMHAHLAKHDLGWWSWDWTGMPLQRPEDMVSVAEWARKRIRQG